MVGLRLVCFSVFRYVSRFFFCLVIVSLCLVIPKQHRLVIPKQQGSKQQGFRQ